MSYTIGGLAQLARALALQAKGHRFDSDILHFIDVIQFGESFGSSPTHLQITQVKKFFDILEK
jgi:hypothetical protein